MEEKLNEKDIIFLAVNKDGYRESLKNSIHLEKDGNIALVFCMDDGCGAAVIMKQKFAEERGWDKDFLLQNAVKNMREKYPCNLQVLDEAQTEGSRVLACENEMFAYTSTGLYYSKDLIDHMAEEINESMYVLPFSEQDTILMPSSSMDYSFAIEMWNDFRRENREVACLSDVPFFYDKSTKTLTPLTENVLLARKKDAKVM